jgi:phage-related protein
VKKLVWVGSSYKDFKEFPPSIHQTVGYALFLAQNGKIHMHAKVLSGMGSAGIQEIRENDKSGTYRVIYTVETGEYVFVLHAFQKKSKSGIATPKQDIELLKNRLKEARSLYKNLI